jgi:hypothetical protein
MDNNLLDQFDTPKFENDEIPLWQKIIFIIIPLAGLICYFAFSPLRPNAKQQALQYAGIGFVINVFLRFAIP